MKWLVLILVCGLSASAQTFSGGIKRTPLVAAAAGGGSPVAFDSKFEKGSTTQTTPFSFVSNAGTVTGTVGNNTNRCLIGHVVFRSLSPTGVGMSWNGTNMTAITNQGGTNFLFGLLNPDTGNLTLTVTWTGGAAPVIVAGGLSFYHVNQTTGWQNAGTDIGTGTSASSTVTTATDNMVAVGHLNNNASSTTIVAPSTSDWVEGALDGNYAAGHRASTNTSMVVSWTLGNSQQWSNVKVDLIKE
jgi:hypothetical protein